MPATPLLRRREILGTCEGAKEDKAGWSAFQSVPLCGHVVHRGVFGTH